jgi:uncharacterized Zn finger protein
METQIMRLPLLNEQLRMVCPTCGNDGVHLTRVVVDAKPSEYKQGETALLYEGECGHLFTLSVGQHKGNAYLKIFVGWNVTSGRLHG